MPVPEPVTVTIALPLADELVARVRAVSERLHIKHLTRMQRYVYRDGRPLWAGYQEPPDPADESEAAARQSLEAALGETEVLLTNPIIPTDLLDRAPRLRWMQLTSAGADRLMETDIVRSGVVQVTTASGLHAASISEYVIGAMIAFAKGLPRAAAAQRERSWRPYMPRELEGATAGIVGLGAIGSRTAELAKALGMRVLAIRRSADQPHPGTQAGVPSADVVLPITSLADLLAESDYVVLAVPLTAETRGLIGEEQLGALKPGAVIINISRGAVIDQSALILALREGRIAGAALDVTDPEPLPSDHELWGAPNVMITPHVSGATPRYMDRAINIFCDNLARYVDDRPLCNLVDPERGY